VTVNPVEENSSRWTVGRRSGSCVECSYEPETTRRSTTYLELPSISTMMKLLHSTFWDNQDMLIIIIIIISLMKMPTLMCSFRWPLRHGTIRPWNWYRRLEDGQPTLQAMSGSPTSCSSGCPWHYRGGMSHFKTRSPPASCCNPLLHILNVLVPTGFVLVGQKIIIIITRTIFIVLSS